MYGMVNQAIKRMVIDVLSEKDWADICSKVKISSEDFQVFQQYDDEVTLNLVLSVCEFTKKEPAEILESFGEYWIKYSFNTEYRDLISTFSTGPVNLIKSLNTLHDRLEISFEELTPPAFDVVSEDTNSLVINYYSERDMPLEFFVKGLFQGIFLHFDKKCNVIMLEEKLGDAKATLKIEHD